MIDTESRITLYEINGKEAFAIDAPRLVIRSHRNRDLVVLVFGEQAVTVARRDLDAAMTAATVLGVR